MIPGFPAFLPLIVHSAELKAVRRHSFAGPGWTEDFLFINKILSVVVGGNPLPLGGGRSLVNS